MKPNTIFRHLLLACAWTACLAGAATLLTACGDDDYEPPVSNNGDLKVVSAALDFPSKGDVRQIEVSSPQPIEASVNKDWAHVAVSGSAVEVTVGKNEQFESRNAIVTLVSGTNRMQLPLTQMGAVWQIRGDDTYVTSDEDTVLVVPASLDFEYTVTMPDWMEGEAVDDGYQLHLLSNDTGAGREGKVVFKSTVGQRTLTFRQFGRKSVLGDYTATFTDDKGKKQTKTITIASNAEDDRIYLHGLSQYYDIPVSIDGSGTLHVEGGGLLDGVTDGYVYIILHSTDGANITEVGFDYLGALTLTKKGQLLVPSYAFKNEQIVYYDMFSQEITATIDGFSLITAALPNILFATQGTVLDRFVGLQLKKAGF